MYDTPVPGTPAVARAPRRPKVTRAPRRPALSDAPRFERLSVSPLAMRTRRKKRNGMERATPAHSLPAADPSHERPGARVGREMKVAILLAAAVLSACAAPAQTPPAPSQPPGSASPVAVATPLPSPSVEPSPTPDVTEPLMVAQPGLPYVTPDIRSLGGREFVFIGGNADLFVDRAIPDADIGVVWRQVDDDVRAVHHEFGLPVRAGPEIFVFSSTASYATGLNRIFGYARSTADFVADNSVSYFEPSSRLIAVNWEAVKDRRPVAAMRHEITHWVTLNACAPRCDLVPAWFNEGQARLAEATIPGADWRLVRIRYEAASMASTGTLLPLNLLVGQLSFNSFVSWAGYYKYQQSARVTELLREDIGGETPIAVVYERLRRGQNIAQAYAGLTGRTWDAFTAALPVRMRALGEGPGIVALPVAPDGAGASYLVYGFPSEAPLTVTAVGPVIENWALNASPFGAVFDTLLPPLPRGTYALTVSDGTTTVKATVKKSTLGSALR